MKQSGLIKQGLFHYWRTNIAVILGVATAVAVLAGALLVGDSVRSSLHDLALTRLGRTDLVIAGTGFFREQLAADLQSGENFTEAFNATVPLIALQGVVIRDENNARAGGVQVYGIDERFGQFHGSPIRTPDGNEASLSHALAAELGAASGDTILLRIEKPTDIPVESLHGRKDQPGSTIRFTVGNTLPAESLGEFSLKPQQGAVRAIFVPLRKLQRNLEQDGKANIILVSAKDAGNKSPNLLAGILKNKYQLADLGLKLRSLDARRAVVLETVSAVISDAIAEKAKEVAGRSGSRPSEVLTYLANSISIGEKKIPYSLITALDQKSLDTIAGTAIKIQGEPPVVLNAWAAADLSAKPGDLVDLEYYVWRQEGQLDTKQTQFRVAAVVPLSGAADDRNYAPDYPGITDTESLSDWDPPFPLDLARVRPRDEDYWRKFKTTPKAFILLEEGQKIWSSRYGKLTSIRFNVPDGGDPQSQLAKFSRDLRDETDPVEMGLAIQSVRMAGMQASRGATDFGEYFTYFSFFLVISALLLTTLFFRLGIEQRLREIGLLRAVGFPVRRIRSLFLSEGFLLAVAGSLVGLIGAVAYGALMMYGLRTWWVGAVGTTLLKLHINPASMVIGFVSGIITALICIWWTLRRLAASSPRSLLSGSISQTDGQRSGSGVLSAKRSVVVFSIAGLIFLLAATFNLIGQAGGFFGAGSLFLIAVLSLWSYWLKSDKKRLIQGRGLLPLARLGFRNASYRPGRSVMCIALIASAAFIIVSVDAFRRDGSTKTYDPKSGNGGYKLVAESLLPVVRNLNGEQGREELNLVDKNLDEARITRFRLRPGDDASCLNLYQPRNPRIIGAGREFIDAGRFAFQSSIEGNELESRNPWLLLNREINSDNKTARVIPAIADANSLAYVLHLKLGDEITVNAGDGSEVRLRIVAALDDSIFQSELLISEQNFIRFFPDIEGHRYFLIDGPLEKIPAISSLLEDRLSDFGFDAIGTEEKLAGFHQVENTYLSTFQTLGGLGLLLGTLGLAAVLLRNVLERRRELALMRAVGFQPRHLSLMVIAENLLLLGCGLLSGLVCALLAIAPAFIARGGHISAVSLWLLLAAVLITGLAASVAAVLAIARSPLIPALRTE